MSAPKHTPLPWYADGPEVLGLDGNGDFGEHVATAWNAPGGPEPEGAVANAALIVRAVNAHADLLAAAEAVLASLRAGLGEITGQGVRSPAFHSRADETAAALRDLKAAVDKAKGA